MKKPRPLGWMTGGEGALWWALLQFLSASTRPLRVETLGVSLLLLQGVLAELDRRVIWPEERITVSRSGGLHSAFIPEVAKASRHRGKWVLWVDHARQRLSPRPAAIHALNADNPADPVALQNYIDPQILQAFSVVSQKLATPGAGLADFRRMVLQSLGVEALLPGTYSLQRIVALSRHGPGWKKAVQRQLSPPTRSSLIPFPSSKETRWGA